MDLRLKQIETITNNFSENQKVGSGWYGDVYKAVLNGKKVALKKLHPLQGLDDKEFHSTLLDLTNVPHKNVVQFIGYCYEYRHKHRTHNGETIWTKQEERVICFEYVEGESLDKYITDGSCRLDWPTCYNVIKGTCEGLNHLHSAQEDPIFHLNLKTANILLDKSMTPKIADLGLSGIFPSSKIHREEILKRTPGHMPPEYLDRDIISRKFDVYSLGVIIIKMMAGNMGFVHCSEISPNQFIELVSDNWRERLQAMSLNSSHEIEILRVRRCLDIALRCLDFDRVKRPSLMEIICELEEPIVEIKTVMAVSPDQISNMVGEMNNSIYFTLTQLETITNNFSADQKIGSGGYADVYRAVHNGKNIVVKKLHPLQGVDDNVFDNELRNVTKARHKNVLQLIGYCHESRRKHIEHKGELFFTKTTDRILCFEYMQGGNLDRYIADESCTLDWPTCYSIIKGSCKGLNYLHNAGEKPIFHLDLKPTNILLDMSMTPKIADLGFSRLVSSSKTQMTDIICETREYMPPEYIYRGIISKKFDVFSLGVIIIKMLAGNMGFSRCSEMSPSQFIELVSKNWEEKLHTTTGHSSHEIAILQVRTCACIALRCIHVDRDKRPSLQEIIWVLEINKILPVPADDNSNWVGQDSQSRSVTDQSIDHTGAHIKTNLIEAEVTTILSQPHKKQMTILSLHPDLDPLLCCTTAPDSKALIEPENKTILSVPSDHKFTRSGLDFGSRSMSAPDKSKDPILQTGTESCLSLQCLKDITNNFCDENIVGRGGFGVIYKGMLQNRKMIAVKRLLQSIPSSQKQFENEVNLLMKLKHPNIVQLVGYCYETQYVRYAYEGDFIFVSETESLLCLEYMPKGSLDNYISDASSGLDWQTRSIIIEGISLGLQYLHEQYNNHVIHLDLKPANILLDKNMVPKITDFGISRLFDQKQTIYTAITSGTRGYMPPEYVRGTITPKWDIFSLGVIIMEIITGHRDYPYDIKKDSGDFIKLELQKWRNRLQKERICTSLETDYRKIERCIQIGLICVNNERTKRPTMKKIIDMLQGLESLNWYIINELSNPEAAQ